MVALPAAAGREAVLRAQEAEVQAVLRAQEAEVQAVLRAQEAEVQVCFAELAIPLEHPCTLYDLLHH